jgi:hypothetical protein
MAGAVGNIGARMPVEQPVRLRSVPAPPHARSPMTPDSGDGASVPRPAQSEASELVSASGAALRAIGTNLRYARKVVPTVDKFRQDLLERRRDLLQSEPDILEEQQGQVLLAREADQPRQRQAAASAGGSKKADGAAPEAAASPQASPELSSSPSSMPRLDILV